MLNAVFRPVEAWPGQQTPSHKRKRSRFKASYVTTLDDLEREFAAIRAKDVVIQCYLDRDDIRNDGWPRSKARPKQPGVIVTFLQGKDVISMPCDTFLDWEQNVRAIALTLHALRMVSQYGVTKHNEQYTGFKRIEAPKPALQMTVEEAAQFIASQAVPENSYVGMAPSSTSAAISKRPIGWRRASCIPMRTADRTRCLCACSRPQSC